MTRYNQAVPPDFLRGFASYDDVDKQGKWLTYDEVSNKANKLLDADYRTILKLKIIRNNRDTTIKTIDDALYASFANDLYLEEFGVMRIIYWYAPHLKDVVKFAIKNDAIPRPAGVEIVGVELPSFGGYFGLPSYDDIDGDLSKFTGFTSYDEFDTKVGGVLNYDKMTI